MKSSRSPDPLRHRASAVIACVAPGCSVFACGDYKKPLATLLLLAATLVARAALVGPYAPDANTLHLWHLNETSTPAVDSATAGINLSGLLSGATLGTDRKSTRLNSSHR